MNNKLAKFKEKVTLNPIMTFLILTLIVILLSGLLSWLGLETNYNKINANTGEYENVFVSVTSLLNLSGMKYIFSNTLKNFTGFTPLSSLIIILIGIGIMEKSGFLKTAFTLLTKYTKKYTVTFIVALLGILFSIAGNISYVVLIPLSALLFKYGKRNPLLGIITSFAALTCGAGISIFFTSVDSTLLVQTILGSHVLDANYTITVWAFLFIMIVATIALAFLITYITERITALKLDKYEFNEEETEITKSDLKGLIISLGAGLIYLLIFIYNIIPGLPLSGALLDYSQTLYIDKLFSSSSFFSMGFVFIITILFIILGLFYGMGAKTIKNNHDFCNYLGHSLDNVGKVIVLMFIVSLFIGVFQKTNIGTVVVALFANVINTTKFTGIPLIFLLFIIGAISTLFLPSSSAKWAILAGATVPVAMNAGLTPEFSQVILRFSESFTLGLTPLFAYFIIYLAFLENYNQDKKPINLAKGIRYIMPYSLTTGLLLIVLLIGWFLIGLPIGIGTYTVL
ncbi:MAG TPA: AbgT family transporter [Bacilli bacterium]|nr:AbgT family transporter [Bacilli bacterium]